MRRTRTRTAYWISVVAGLLALLPVPSVAVDAGGTINSVAGTGTPSFNGDGGPATNAGLNNPTRVTLDQSGNLFIVDSFNGRIRKVDAAGVISTVVSGLFPFDVALDAAGNLYVADLPSNTIRRVDAVSGTVTTVAGTGATGFNGDGIAATSARLTNPAGVRVDAQGNIYIADFGNHRVRRVDAATGIIETVAGNGAAGWSGDGGVATTAQLFNPASVTFDSGGNMFVADMTNHRIRRIEAGSGVISTVAGTGAFGYSGDGGAATDARLTSPTFAALDAGGNLYIADFSNHRVRRVDAATGTISTVAGNGVAAFGGDGGPATAASLNQPQGIAIDGGGNLFIADRFNNRVRKVTALVGSTPVGSGIEVAMDITLPNGAAATVDVTFQTVSAGGVTSATPSEVGPPVPEGFKLGDPPIYYNVSTTATFGGTVRLCFGYPEGQFYNPASIRLLHYENGGWTDVTTSVDSANRVLCGATTSLSPFALVETAYRFTGFFNPITNLPALNNAKAGSAVPVKFSLGGDYGLNIFVPGYPAAQAIACNGQETGEIAQASAAGASNLSYDDASGQYTYVWKTDKSWTGCKQLVVRFNDGSAAHIASFQFR